MLGRLFGAALGATLAVTALSAGALAATSTSDLVPGPPDGPWVVDPAQTGSLSASDIYGSGAGSIKGFVDAYHKSWSQPAQWIDDGVEHYSTLLWAAFRLGESEAAAKKNKAHSSYAVVPGFGNGAYEVTDPPDADGFKSDTFVFIAGDYMAAITIAAHDATPDRSVLMDQVRRQLDLIPEPLGEYNSIGSWVTSAFGLFVGFIVLNLLVGGAVVAVVLLRRRRPQMLPISVMAAGLHLSPDRGWWWDGQRWIDASAQSPPSAQRSADGEYWWDGATWRRVAKRADGGL